MRPRAEGMVFGLAVAAGWLLASASELAAPSLARARVIAASPESAGAALRAGASAASRGDYEQADRLFRTALGNGQTREAAATALRDLHRTPGFPLVVDETEVAKTAGLLGPGFGRTETAHFVILSDVEKDWTRRRGALLERTYHQFFRVMDRLEHPAHPPERKLICVLFADHAMYTAFARAHDGVEAPWIAGYYAGLANRVVFYDDRTGPSFAQAFGALDAHERTVDEMKSRARSMKRSRDESGRVEAENLWARAEELSDRIDRERTRLNSEAARASEAKTIHEAVHLLAFNCGAQSRAHQYPFWITEGLAVAFETDEPEAAFGPDRASGAREAEMERFRAEGRLIDVGTLVQLTRPPDRDQDTVDVLYAQSYALVSHLYRYERRALGEFLLAIRSEPAGLIPPERLLEIFEGQFGPVEAFERRWQKRMAAAAE